LFTFYFVAQQNKKWETKTSLQSGVNSGAL
jgi:hypothetical protein